MAIIGHQRFRNFPEGVRFDADYHVGEGSSEREAFRKGGISFQTCFPEIVHPGEFTREYVADGIPFLRAQNVKPGRIDAASVVRVSRAIYERLPEAVAQQGDLLIVRTGANVGDVARVPKRFAGSLVSSHTLRLVPADGTPVCALAAFLASDMGQKVLRSLETGSAQGQINGSSLKTLFLPKLNRLESKCRELLDAADAFEESSLRQYPEAEAELLDRLGWAELTKQPRELCFSMNFSDIFTATRNDAEFFEPRCRRLLERIRKAGGKTIGEFCPEPSRGVQPDFSESGTVLALDSKSVRTHGVEPSGERVTQAFCENDLAEKGRVRPGDVLLNSTGRGTLGRAAFYQLNHRAVCDNHVAILRPDPKFCLPRYLALFLNSPAGLTQSEQFQTGSSGQLEIYPQHIKQFLIYLPRTKSGAIDLTWQEKLSGKVETATRAREQAKAKLAEAKRLVEDAIAVS